MHGAGSTATTDHAGRRQRTGFCCTRRRTEGVVHVEDLDISADRFSEAAKRVMDRAVEDSRRRGHSLLSTAHLFLAVAQADSELFAQAMDHAAVNPHDVLKTVDEHLGPIPA